MKQSYIKYIIAFLLFGSNGIVASFISMDSCEIVFSRTMLGSLLLLTIFLAGKRKFTFYKYKKQSLLPIKVFLWRMPLKICYYPFDLVIYNDR